MSSSASFAKKTGAASYREVQGLSRGLAVLRALNTRPGGVGNAVELAKATGLHRTTVKRLLETLKLEGLVHHNDDSGDYILGFEVRKLSAGYTGVHWIDAVAAPSMRAHLQHLTWPSDLAVPDDGFMIVRESTHQFSLLSQHRATIGIRVPMLVSALGRAWLTWCAPQEREATLAMLRARDDEIGELARDVTYVRRLIRETRRRGYAVNHGEWSIDQKILAIAFPIMVEQKAIGAINLVIHLQALSNRKVALRYVPLLRNLANEISAGASQQLGE